MRVDVLMVIPFRLGFGDTHEGEKAILTHVAGGRV